MNSLPNALETEQTPATENRQGFALAGALLALVIVGALVTGSFYAASQEQSIGLSSKYNDEALYVAETALNQAVGRTSINLLDTLSTPLRLDTAKAIVVNNDTLGRATVWVRRIAGDTFADRFLFVSRGTAAGGGSRGGGQRIIGLVTEIMRASFPANSAMLLYDGIQVKGSSQVNGTDMFPTGSGYDQFWTGCTTTSAKAGIITRPGTLVDSAGSADVMGNPPVARQALDSAAFLNYGAFDYDYIAAMASKVYYGGTLTTQPSLLNGVCNTSDPLNWGEPGSAAANANIIDQCKDYWPVIHSVGRTNVLHLSGGGRGQGVLLVDGDLDLSGGFDFWGVVVVKGKLTTSGTGGHIYGTVLSFGQGDLNVDPTQVVGNSVVNFSSCAIAKASANMEGMNYAMPIKAHAWVDLTAAGAGY